jgi:hypothetical protein
MIITMAAIIITAIMEAMVMEEDMVMEVMGNY